MSIFKCKMCGGTLEIQPNATVAECEYCGTTQTLPKLDDGRKANLFDRANHFRRNNEFDKAAGIYEQILNEDGSDAETYWSLVLCRFGIEYVEDPATHKRVPTVNRAQFTSIFDDDNYKSALNYADGYQRSIYEDEAKAINEIQKGILAISQKEEPFDVFICYKETDNSGRRTPDSVLATDLYHQLTQEGFKVFFSRITLEDKLGTAYEPYIFAALNSAKVMVVLGTKPEYFNAVWVKNEWSRYLALIKTGAKKLLIPAYKDMDPYDLPEEFSHLQAQDMSKLGFMQDLIRGIKKILAEDAPKPAAKATVVVNAGNANTAALLERVFMFLEDGDWKSADEYCERVLDTDPKNAQAYLGKLMAELRVYTRDDLKNCSEPFAGNNNYEKIKRFGDAALQNEVLEANSFIRYTNAMNAKKQATSERAFNDAARKFMMLEGYRDADDQKQECLKLAEDARKEAVCREAERLSASMYTASPDAEELQKALDLYKSISGWKTVDTKAIECQQQIEQLKADAEAERLEKIRQSEFKAKEAARKAKRYKKIAAIVISAIAFCIALALLMNTVVIPNNEYKKAVVLMDEGRYEEAYDILVGIGNYKNTKELLKRFRVVYQTMVENDKHTYSYSYDPEGKLVEEFHTSNDEDYKDWVREYSYDAAGNLVKTDSPYGTTEFSYDSVGNRVKAVGIGFNGGKDVTLYSYDSEGNLVKETDPSGFNPPREYFYDSSGHLVKEVVTYDSDSVSIYEYKCDSDGNIVKKWYTYSDGTKDVTEYSYNAAGYLVKEVFTYSSGKRYANNYRYENRLVFYIP